MIVTVDDQEEFEEKLEREEFDELLDDRPHPLCLNIFFGFMAFLTTFNGFTADRTAAPAAAPRPKPGVSSIAVSIK